LNGGDHEPNESTDQEDVQEANEKENAGAQRRLLETQDNRGTGQGTRNWPGYRTWIRSLAKEKIFGTVMKNLSALSQTFTSDDDKAEHQRRGQPPQGDCRGDSMIASGQEYERAREELKDLESRLDRLQREHPGFRKGLTKAGIRKMIARLHEELALYKGGLEVDKEGSGP
jgi:hypothetical protein